jgi:tetratricopeptide (TPR) repeat protein
VGLGEVGDDPEAVAARVRAAAVREQLVAALDDWAWVSQDAGRGQWVLGVARRVDPDPWRDRFRDPALWEDRAALERLAWEAQVEALSPQLLTTLGRILKQRGVDAVPLLAAAQARYPNDFWLNFGLGGALADAKKPDEAIGYYRAALALRPQTSAVYNNLGLALQAKGRLDEAIAAFQQAIALDPKLAPAHNNLGIALRAKGRLDEATAAYQQALALDPKFAPAHYNLGNALADKGRLDEAIAAYQQALALDPKFARAHGNLGYALLQQGRFIEARSATRRCLELLPEGDPRRQRASRQLEQCERFLALDAKLPAVLKGEAQPANAAERLAYARLCQSKKLYRAAARFCADAFAAEPKLADDLQAQHRYNAACYAALAGHGQGEDAQQLDAAERTRWRQQALAWLRADLTAYTKLLDGDKPDARTLVQQRMRHWQQDTDLAGLRDKDALAKLPAEEREACQKLWADVAELRKKADNQ